MDLKTWIPVNETMPPERYVKGLNIPVSSLSESVLTCNSAGQMSVGCYSFSNQIWSTDADGDEPHIWPVTHWMHLPDSPIYIKLINPNNKKN